MRIAIHQPHFFPWLGYFDKIKDVDIFVLLDEVQFEKGSQMSRNRVLDNNGNIKYLTISCDTTDFLNRSYRDISTKDNPTWIHKQINCLCNYYRNSNFKKEIDSIMQNYYQNDYNTVFQWTYESIRLSCDLLEISTPIILQSQIEYDKTSKRSDLVLEICKQLGADEYYSGKGASVNYLDKQKFNSENIDIVFQNFEHPVYEQLNSDAFVPGLSILDYFYSCGIDRAKALFGE